jgi:hypothetical protein
MAEQVIDFIDLEAARRNRERIAKAQGKMPEAPEPKKKRKYERKAQIGKQPPVDAVQKEEVKDAPVAQPTTEQKELDRYVAQPKESAEEVEDKGRHCLFCSRQPPDDLPCHEMKGGKGHWYSNALLDVKSGATARFYLCPNHLYRRRAAWQWAKQGFEGTKTEAKKPIKKEAAPIPEKPKPGPHGDYLLALHRYYKANKDAILSDLANLGLTGAAKRWKMSLGTLGRMSGRYPKAKGKE